MGLDVAFSLVTLIITNAISPVTSHLSDLFLSSLRFSPTKLGIQLFLFFCHVQGHRLRDTRHGMDRPAEGCARRARRNRCIHLRMESVSRNVIAAPLFALGLFVLLLIIATAAPMAQFPIYLLPAVQQPLAKQLAKKR